MNFFFGAQIRPYLGQNFEDLIDDAMLGDEAISPDEFIAILETVYAKIKTFEHAGERNMCDEELQLLRFISGYVED